MSTSKYGKNRNRWKRTYPYINRKPRVTQVQDDVTKQSLNLDLNRYAFHRDHFELTSPPLLQSGYTAEYEEGLIFFDNAFEVTGTFVRCFDNVPYVTYTPESASYGVNVFGIAGEPSATTFRVGASAPFTGYVRYRAVALNPTAVYPKFLDFLTGNTTTASLWVAAGTASLDSSLTQFTASFSMPSIATLELRLEAHDALGNSGSNIAFEIDNLSTSGAMGRISAPLNDNVHFQATIKIS